MWSIAIPQPGSLTNLESVLRRRGQRIKQTGDPDSILFPNDNLNAIRAYSRQAEYADYFNPQVITPYLKLFAKRSFRKVVKILIDYHPEPAPKSALVQVCGSSMGEYFNLLRRLLLITETESHVTLLKKIPDIGRSFEHYVSELMTREFDGSSKWGVVLDDLPIAGGDYDVLAWLDPSLVYIECKTSDPKNIGRKHVKHFMQRSVELAPDLAIFLVDTDDSIEDLVANKFLSVISDALVDPRDRESDIENKNEIHPVYPDIYSVFVYPCVYVAKTSPWIETQIARCIKHYYAHSRRRPFYFVETDFSK